MTSLIPRPAPIGVVDRGLRDAKPLRQVGEGRSMRRALSWAPDGSRVVLRSDRRYLLSGQHRTGVELAPQISRSAFGNPIGDVVGVRSEDQVVRSNTRGIIATVKDMGPDRNRAIGEQPRDAMGIDVCAFWALNPNVTIALTTPVRRPKPATISPLDVFPESNIERFVLHALSITTYRRMVCYH